MKETPIIKLLLRLSPPVMLALLIQSVYNIVDSYFVARYSAAGLTALSIIFPIQLLMTALAAGTGTGMNILISRMDGTGDTKSQSMLIKNGLFLGLSNYLFFCVIGLSLIHSYYMISSDLVSVRTQGIQYAQIIFIGSIGQFLEANCTKILQAKGNMFTPMLAQIAGAAINVIFDPILIFGLFGMPSIVMQSLYALYIVGLNLILKQFTEDAVTVLGIYYKLQTFFFIPLMGLQQVILPVISFNYGAGKEERVKDVLKYSTIDSCSYGHICTISTPVTFHIFGQQTDYADRQLCASGYMQQLHTRRSGNDVHGLLSRC